MRLHAAMALIVLGSTHAGAQAPAVAAPHRYPPAPAAPSHSVHAEYDAQYDKTVLQLDPVTLDSTLAVSALVALDGRAVRKDAAGVVLTFWSTAAGRPLGSARNVRITVDGTPTDLGDAWLTPNPQPGFTEVAMRSIPLDVWLSMAAAAEPRVRIGTREFVLSKDAQQAMQDFASRMAPRTSPP